MKITPLENQGKRVLTTSQLAESFGTTPDRISKNFSENKQRYIEGKHFNKIEGVELLHFRNSEPQLNISPMTRVLYLWTEKGAWLHAKSLNTDRAWEAYEMLVDEYYRVTQEKALQQFNIPQTLSEALRFAAELSDKNEAMQKKIEQDKPLVVFAESVQVSQDSILVRDMAKLLKQNGIETGETRFFEYLRDNGYLIKSGTDYNMPTQRSMNLGIMEVKTGTRNGSNGVTRITRTPKITGKGQVYFMNKFLNKLPQVR